MERMTIESSLPDLRADDFAIAACCYYFEGSSAAERAAEAAGDDEGFLASADLSRQILESIASFKAASIEALLAQARGLIWLYAPDPIDRPLILAGSGATLEQRLIRALVLGLLDLSRPLSTQGDVHAQVKAYLRSRPCQPWHVRRNRSRRGLARKV